MLNIYIYIYIVYYLIALRIYKIVCIWRNCKCMKCSSSVTQSFFHGQPGGAQRRTLFHTESSSAPLNLYMTLPTTMSCNLIHYQYSKIKSIQLHAVSRTQQSRQREPSVKIVPHFLPNSKDIACWMAELNTGFLPWSHSEDLCPYTTTSLYNIYYIII